MRYARKTTGESFKPDVRLTNDIVELVNSQDGAVSYPQIKKAGSYMTLPVYNCTGATLTKGTPVEVYSEIEATHNIYPIVPASGASFFGILLETLASSDCGSMLISGCLEVDVTGDISNYVTANPSSTVWENGVPVNSTLIYSDSGYPVIKGDSNTALIALGGGVSNNSASVTEAGIAVTVESVTEIEEAEGEEVEVEYWNITLTPSDSFFIQNKTLNSYHEFHKLSETTIKVLKTTKYYAVGIFPYLSSLTHTESATNPTFKTPTGYCFGFINDTKSDSPFYPTSGIFTTESYQDDYLLIDRPLCVLCFVNAVTGEVVNHNPATTFTDCSYYGWFNFVQTLYGETYQWYLLSGKVSFGVVTAYLQATEVTDDDCYIIATYDDNDELTISVSNSSATTSNTLHVWYIASDYEYPTGLLVTGRLEP